VVSDFIEQAFVMFIFFPRSFFTLRYGIVLSEINLISRSLVRSQSVSRTVSSWSERAKCEDSHNNFLAYLTPNAAVPDDVHQLREKERGRKLTKRTRWERGCCGVCAREISGKPLEQSKYLAPAINLDAALALEKRCEAINLNKDPPAAAVLI